MRVYITGTSGFIGFHLCKSLLEDGYDIQTGQEFLGHKDIKTTMIHPCPESWSRRHKESRRSVMKDLISDFRVDTQTRIPRQTSETRIAVSCFKTIV
mgnify:CR=1 FL=1